MCSTDIPAPPPPPAPPPILEQLAPKSASSDTSSARKRKGMSRYKIQKSDTSGTSTQLGGIPTKTGV